MCWTARLPCMSHSWTRANALCICCSNSIGWMNFAPIAAIALCAAAYFPLKYKFTVPMMALLLSDVVLNTHYGFSLLSPFVLSH
jgi:Family of unknown function (DUF6580)